MHLVLARDNLKKTMVYMVVDFSLAAAQIVSFYSMVTPKHTLFTGTTRTIKAGINMFDAYTVGTAT